MSTTPKRIQRKRTKGWKMPEGAVYVGRPTRWGNPFEARKVAHWPSWGGAAPWEVVTSDGKVWDWPSGDRPPDRPVIYASRAHGNAHHQGKASSLAVHLFGLHIGPMGNYEYDDETLADLRATLGGHDLACWCPLDQPCHADVLLKIANPTPPARRADRDEGSLT